MNIYLNEAGRYYAAAKAASPNDSTVVSPSPKLVALLQGQTTPVKVNELAEVFAREKDEPGFIMSFVEARDADKE